MIEVSSKFNDCKESHFVINDELNENLRLGIIFFLFLKKKNVQSTFILPLI